MLIHLRIRNLALVADLALDLRPGFNVITGETGAGKSILIGALNLLLGERADRSLLRAGCETCSVEAVVDIRRLRAPVAQFLADNGLEPADDGHLILKRTLTATGANRQFVNGSPTSLQTLAVLGEWLVDIHGPHDHQSLFHAGRQLELLDAQGGLEEIRSVYSELHDQRMRILEAKAALIVDEASFQQRLDLLRHQVREIEAARLTPEDENQLEAEHARIRNAARLMELCQESLGLLAENDDALLARAGHLGRSLQEMERLDPASGGWSDAMARLNDAMRDLRSEISHYADRLDVDPARLAHLEERLDLLHSLRRKYGATVERILAFGEEARRQLQQLEGRDAELVRLQSELEKVETTLAIHGADLTAQRRKTIPRLTKGVSAQLKELGFRQSEFGVALSPASSPQRTGLDKVEFQFAPNPGEPPRPLRAIASSGELARVMLALKTVLSQQDDIPVVVFDEVDANIGGETAHAVGEKMRQIGKRRQVLCITHLAPVAAAGDAHWVVRKSSREGRTVSEVIGVEGAERLDEIARMLGGGAAARQHAASLMGS
ncbi:MAG: DNA repair protein RecN [Verrucomicrobiales bacterium]|nr:DNA repair protein RecN [Verrucomicrobiales bacterium]